MYRNFGKRLFDMMFSLAALIFLCPLFVLIWIFVKLDSPGPVFFFQKRLGQNAREFFVYKFRTMTDSPRIPKNEIMGRNSEVTKIGYWLRRFKLDELPQLINIFKGDMSVAGPRPALPTQLSELDENGQNRLRVRPGLTGLAQVSGNIYLTWPERWQYDSRYVDKLSFKLDLKIITRSVAVVILGEHKFIKSQISDQE